MSKWISLIIGIALVFTSTTLSAQTKPSKTFSFQAKYKRGQVFRYQVKTSFHQVKGEFPIVSPKRSFTQVYRYKVLVPMGKKAICSFRVESIDGKVVTKGDVLDVEVKVLVGPGLEIVKVYGLDKLAERVLGEVKGWKKLVLQQVTSYLNRALASRKGIVTAGTFIEKHPRAKVGTVYPKPGEPVTVEFLHIKTWKGQKVAVLLAKNEMGNWLTRAFGLKSKVTGEYVVNSQGIPVYGTEVREAVRKDTFITKFLKRWEIFRKFLPNIDQEQRTVYTLLPAKGKGKGKGKGKR